MAATARITENVIDLLHDSPYISEALQKRNAKVTLERRGLIGELKGIDLDADVTIPALRKAEADAEASLRKAQAALRAAQQKYDSAVGARYSTSIAYGTRRDDLEAQLKASASPLILDFLREMGDLWDATRKTSITMESESIHNQVTGRVVRGTRTNYQAIVDKMSRIREAQEDARELMLSEPDQSAGNIQPKLAALRDSIN